MEYGIILLMTFLGAYASVRLKKAVTNKYNFKDVLFSLDLYLGGFLYLIAALLNIYVLSLLDYTVVLPLTSITYVWTMILSYYIFKEKIGHYKKVGLILIMLGALLVVL